MNTERKRLVAHLAATYRDATDEGADMETAIVDLVADLLHHADTLPADERVWFTEGLDGGADAIGETVAEKALMHYLDERDEDA